MKIANFSTLSVFFLLMSAPVVMGQDPLALIITIVGTTVNILNDIGGPVFGVVGIDFQLSVTDIVGALLDIASDLFDIPNFDSVVNLVCDPLKDQIATIGASTNTTCTCAKVAVDDAVSLGIRVQCDSTAEVCATGSVFCGRPSADVILNLNLGEQDLVAQNFVVGTDQAIFCLNETSSTKIMCIDFPLQGSVSANDFANAALTINPGTTATMTDNGVDTLCVAPTVPCPPPLNTDPLTVQIDCAAAGGPSTGCKNLFFQDVVAPTRV